MVLFLLGNVLHYLGHATYDAYYSLHISGLGLSDAFVGTAWSVGVTVEIGVMFLAPGLMGRLRSPTLLMLGSGAALLRWAGLSVAASRPALLALQGLHGLTFGLWYLSMVHHVQSRSSERLRSTLQAAATAAMGTGMLSGYLLGGQVMEAAGGHGVFRMAAAAAGGAVAVYGVVSALERRRSAERTGGSGEG
jgi:predicted MFS family arabinose efflux permease